MGAGHAHALYVHEHSPVHRLSPETKLVATFVFVTAVAITPRQAVWAFAIYGAVVVAVAAVSRLRAGFVLIRLTVVVPFILLAVMVPFVASGEQVEILFFTVSRDGLWGAWNIFAKAVLGASASIILAATTEVPAILEGMGRLRVPPMITAIAGFMVRYLEVIVEELGRMRTAMTARAYQPRWIWDAGPIASSAGALFIRSYERGERIYQAMLARGFTGTMPPQGGQPATGHDWLVALSLPVLAMAVAVIALVIT
jgi:cobalt/nickel transport system permease protein